MKNRRVLAVAVAALPLLVASGCSRFRHKAPDEQVYVLQKQAYLRDHVAAVSNHTGQVANGQKLDVLERGKRFIRVRTEKGETGWLEERYTTPVATYDKFEQLKQSEVGKPVVATAVVRDEAFLHLTPGRDTDHLWLEEEGDKIKLLQRASLLKPLPPGQPGLPKPATATPGEPVKPPAAAPSKPGAEPKKKHGAAVIEGAPAEPMEDWWLVRDPRGNVGWMLGRRFDVDVLDAIAGYSEGQRFVGAYQLSTVMDPDAGNPGGQVPIWLAVMAPYKDGLPYDFNQLKVFGWNRERHRYELDYRERDLWGFLPVDISTQVYPKMPQPLPTFQFRNDADKSATVDPETGLVKVGATDVRTYRLEGNIVRRVLPEVPKPAAVPQPQNTAKPIAPKRATAARRKAAPQRRHHSR